LGEHVLISGDQSATIKLFKVVAELWPWGTGRVELPGDASIFFMPERPYLPAGTLRASLSYPASRTHFDDAALTAALHAVGLEYLFAHLEDHNTWAKALTTMEQQRLGFARLLLHRPNWIFLQEATDALDAEGEEAMMRLLMNEFPDATVLTVGYHAELETFHQRKLDLVRKEDGLGLIADRRKSGRPAAQTPPARFYSQMVNIANKDINLAEISSAFE
jgi:putative ATP-binding cassette transporter